MTDEDGLDEELFEEGCKALRKAILKCGKPGNNPYEPLSDLNGQQYFLCFTSALLRIAVLNINFHCDTDPELGRRILEEIETDLLAIRKEKGWLND